MGKRTVIRRPASGICQFCLKQITAPNWSRHIKSMHKGVANNKMSIDEPLQPPQEEPLGSSTENSPIKTRKLKQEAAQGRIAKTETFEPEEEGGSSGEMEGDKGIAANGDCDDGQQQNQPHQEEMEEEISAENNIEQEEEEASPEQPQNPLRRSKRTAARRLRRCAIKLPKTDICPLCEVKTSQGNWSRHLRRHHPEYSISLEGEQPPQQTPPIPPKLAPADEHQQDLPMLRLEQFLAQQMQQHNGKLFAADDDNSNDGILGSDDGMAMGSMLEMDVDELIGGAGGSIVADSNQEEEEANDGREGEEGGGGEGTSSGNLAKIGAQLFPQRRIIIRRPASGICQFCLRTITPSNWSRHLRTVHLKEIVKMRQNLLNGRTSPNIQPKEELLDYSCISPEPPNGVLSSLLFVDEPAAMDRPVATAIAHQQSAPIVLLKTEDETGGGEPMGSHCNSSNFDDTMTAVIEGGPVPLRRSQRNANKNVIKKCRSAMRLPKSGICPLCERVCQPGNWSRHLRRHHPEFALMDDEEGPEGVCASPFENIDAEFVVPSEEVRSFIIRCMQSAGTSFAHAVQLAELLLDADLVGHYSYGLSRLPTYVQEVSRLEATGEPRVLKQKGATAFVDGANLLGPVVGNFCTDLAIKLAREHGIGWVLANNSNHYGIGQYYARRIAQVGMVGMSFSNSSTTTTACQPPQRQQCPNMISCGANSQRPGDGLMLDMPMPSSSSSSSSAATFFPPSFGGGLMDGGDGEEETIDGMPPKANGLGMMVELFCGIMAGGANFGQNPPANLHNQSQCFVAIDPHCFAPGFPAGLQQFFDRTRENQQLVPGDEERMNATKSQEAGGLVYQWAQIRAMEKLALKCRAQMFAYKQKQQN